MHIKKGDTVQILSGKDKGKSGKVLKALPKENKVIVEGINVVKRHQRPRAQVQRAIMQYQAGIIQKPAPIFASKAMLICPKCQRATRTIHVYQEGKKVRRCKRCGENIDKV